jgi:glutathione synthase/RimK-type ligase-like ATP-grasp enzyme
MKAKIAISKGASKFHLFAIEYCDSRGIDYKMVDMHSPDLRAELNGCDFVFWHFRPADRFAARILRALEAAGLTVFPNSCTSWSFDDKISQAIFFSMIDAPMPRTHLFFDEKQALSWAKNCTLPTVWKLSTGAGSQNVRLIETRRELRRLVRQSFRSGFWTYRKWYILKWRIDQLLSGQGGVRSTIAALYRLFVLPKYIVESGKERGYFLAQDFVAGNDQDIRIIVIGERAFGIVRKNRKGDFRASASGLIHSDPALIDEKFVKLAFDLSGKVGAQCLAYDFIENKKGDPLVVEICYGFTPEGYYDCPGYWRRDLSWTDAKIEPYAWMIDELLSQKA